MHEVPVICPWDFYHAAFVAGEEQFRRSAVGEGGDAALQAYWDNAMRLPWGQKHPLANSPNDFKHAIPLAYFMDGGEFSDGSSALLTTCSSICCGKGHAFDKSCLICLLPEDRCLKAGRNIFGLKILCHIQVLPAFTPPRITMVQSFSATVLVVAAPPADVTIAMLQRLQHGYPHCLTDACMYACMYNPRVHA